MRIATIALLGILLLGSFAPMRADDPVAASQVAIAYMGTSVSTSDTTGICMWYPVLFGDLDLQSLFATPSLFGTPAVDKEHAYLIWVSDFSIQVLQPKDFKDINFLGVITAGSGTIYFTDRPDLRDWRDWTNRSTWGQPVARFIRRAGLFPSADNGYSALFSSTSELVSSTTFIWNGKEFNFRNLIPHGMTCAENAIGDAEVGTCVAVGVGWL